MAVNDTIADFLTRIRNASTAGQHYVDVPWSVLTQKLAELLKQELFIAQFLVKEENKKKKMRLFLRYLNKKPLIKGLKRVSTSGRRVYVSCDKIPNVNSGLGISIVSTSKGVLIGSEARKERVGGEVLCNVW